MTDVVRVVSGFVALVTGVQAYFAALPGDPSTKTLVLCGYRERAKQIQGGGGANRVIFLPGDPNGAAGKIGASPRDVGRRELNDANGVHVANIRPLASWERQFTLSIWGWDPAHARDELAQGAVAEDLFEITMRAVEGIAGAGGPNVSWGATAWTVPKENTRGAELLVGLAMAHPLMDAPEEIGFPGFGLGRVGADT